MLTGTRWRCRSGAGRCGSFCAITCAQHAKAIGGCPCSSSTIWATRTRTTCAWRGAGISALTCNSISSRLLSCGSTTNRRASASPLSLWVRFRAISPRCRFILVARHTNRHDGLAADHGDAGLRAVHVSESRVWRQSICFVRDGSRRQAVDTRAELLGAFFKRLCSSFLVSTAFCSEQIGISTYFLLRHIKFAATARARSVQLFCSDAEASGFAERAHGPSLRRPRRWRNQSTVSLQQMCARRSRTAAPTQTAQTARFALRSS